MAKKAFLRDHDNIEILPITRGELVLDSSGNVALHSNEFLATDSQPGLMSKEDKSKIDKISTSTLEISNLLTAGKKIATISVGSTSYNILAPATYAWSEITNRPTNLSQFTDDVVAGKYLPLTGGTVHNSTHVPLSIQRDDLDKNVFIRFVNKEGSGLGSLGVSTLDTPAFLSSGGDAIFPLIHSGNVGDYAIKRSTNISLEDDLNVAGYGGRGKGWPYNGAALILGYDKDYKFYLQADFSNSSHFIKTRYYGAGSWRGDWKTIAFTDSNVASSDYATTAGSATSATKLAKSVSLWGNTFDGTQSLSGSIYINLGSEVTFKDNNNSYSAICYNSTSTFTIGYGTNSSSRTINTYLDGYNIYFRSGAKSTAMTITEEGNVGIGTPYTTSSLTVRQKTNGAIALGSSDNLAATFEDIFGGYGFMFNVQPSGACNIQVGRTRGETEAFALNLNPLGGKVNIGAGGLNVAGTITGNLDGTYVNKLTGYTKATAISALAATDTLNTALGKLEYKADVAYNLVKGAYDGDGTIENLEEILRVLEGISDTDTIQAIVGKYLPLSGGTLQNGASTAPLILNTTSSTEIGIKLNMSGVNKGWIGYSVHTGFGTYLYNSASNKYIGIKDDGTPHYQGNTLLHSGNYNSYAPKLDGTGATGTWPINITGNSVTSNRLTTIKVFDFDSNKATYCKVASINITGRYSGGSGLLKFYTNRTTSSETYFADSFEVFVHVYQQNPIGEKPILQFKSTNTGDAYNIIGILNYSSSGSTFDIYAYGKGRTYHSLYVSLVHGDIAIAPGSYISSLPSGTQVTPLPMGNSKLLNGFTDSAFWKKTELTKVSQLTNDSGYLTSTSLNNYVTLNTAQTITGLKTFESDSSTTGVSLILKNNNWYGGMATALDFYNGREYKVPNARIETKMNGSGDRGGTLIFYTQTVHASTNPNPNGLVERLRIDDNGHIGIGKVTPYYQLDIANNMRVASIVMEINDEINRYGGPLYLQHRGSGNGSLDSPTGNIIMCANGGNVGIGTSAPEARLHVNGSLLINNTSSGDQSIILRTGTASEYGTYDYKIGKFTDANDITGFGFAMNQSDGSWKKFLKITTTGTYAVEYVDILAGLTVSGYIHSSGFVKFGSNNNYLLLGGGGQKAISDFMLKSDELTNNLTTITKTLTVTKDWMDTGIKYTDLSTGTYVVQVYSHTTDNLIWYGYWSGIMTWYGDYTNSSEADEILLHRGAHGYNSNTIYLRTINTEGSDGRNMRLQIAANKNFSSATYTFKFKRVI